jgi:hypothetical protein
MASVPPGLDQFKPVLLQKPTSHLAISQQRKFSQAGRSDDLLASTFC